MTAYNSTNIPSSINTLEKEIVRLIMAFRDCNPKTSILEEQNFTQSVAQWEIKISPEGKIIFVGRAVIELNSATINTGVKLWTNAIEVPGSAVLPTAYTAN